MTAVELLLVLGIVVSLAGIAAPRYINSIARYRVDAAARRLVGDLAYAQSAARAASSPVTVSFSLNDGSYTISSVPDLSRPAAAYVVSLSADPYGSMLSSVSFPNGANQLQVTFDGYGYPDGAGAIVLSSGAYSKVIQLDSASGKATIQ